MKQCQSRKIPVIFDEVFTGFWRLGVEVFFLFIFFIFSHFLFFMMIFYVQESVLCSLDT